MSSQCYENGVVFISFWDSFQIHFLSFLLGVWAMIKRMFFWLCCSSDVCVKSRNTPPSCYIDSSLGNHSYVKVQRVKFHYVECGIASRPLLLFLHGFPDCWFGWRYQIPVMSHHFRVVALDLKGFGDSDKPAWRRSYHVDKLLRELREFVHALGHTNCVIIGHDLGALLGWYLVHQYPELVEKFVCISCPHPNIYWNELPRSSAFNGSWINFCQLPYLPESEALKEDVKIINKCFQHLEKKKEISCIDVYKYIFARREDWVGPINYYRNLPFTRINNTNEIVQVPCLFITGNKDAQANLESVVKSTEFTEKYTVKVVDGAGHFPHQEMPETINIHLLAFLTVTKTPQKSERPVVKGGLITRVFGAVTSTVRYGNQVFDVVQKKTNGFVSSLPAKTVSGP